MEWRPVISARFMLFRVFAGGPARWSRPRNINTLNSLSTLPSSHMLTSHNYALLLSSRASEMALKLKYMPYSPRKQYQEYSKFHFGLWFHTFLFINSIKSSAKICKIDGCLSKLKKRLERFWNLMKKLQKLQKLNNFTHHYFEFF